MPDSFTVLLDAPDKPVTKVQIAKLGDDFHHGKYGSFAITADEVAEWKQNLAQLPGGRALIDQDHQADRTPRRTEASGWITDVELEDGVPMATVEWTPRGEKAIRDREYLFLSPSFGPYENEKGETFANTLQGAALTNRPHLAMPALQLASAERARALLDDAESGVTQAERDKAHEEGNSLPDKSYPIRNVKQLKAAIELAQSGHGDVAAAKKLILRRAKELGREDLLPDDWKPGAKTLDDAPAEATPLLERNAAEVEVSDVQTKLRVLRAIETVLGLSVEGALDVWQNGKARVSAQASVADLLEAGGLDREQSVEVAAQVAVLQAGVAADRARFAELAPSAEQDRVYTGQLDGVAEPVYLPEGFDYGQLENREVQRRRLEVGRRHAPQGSYSGEKGAHDFRQADNRWAELGLDYPRSLERSSEIARAKGIMKNETGTLAYPIASTTAARTEARSLAAEIRELDKKVEAEDAERADFKRRGVWRAGLAPNAGHDLAQRRDKMIALDDLKQSRAYRLENIPAFTTALEQIRGGGAKVKLLAAELTGAAPSPGFDLEVREEVDRRAKQYLLDHDLPITDYKQALDAVLADRDRAPGQQPPERTPLALVDTQSAVELDRAVQKYLHEHKWPTSKYLEALNIIKGWD